MSFLSRFTLTKTITALTVGILALALAAVSLVIAERVSSRIKDQAVADQDSSLRAAATLVERDLPGLTVSWSKNGNVERITAEAIPESFTEHRMIDAIGRMTGQTATIFGWDAASKDFWRRTTNIIKPDGSRAVGTALGKTGAVYAAITKGQVYRGKATILDTPYYTIYQPVFSKDGSVIGILYAGVRAAEIDSMATDLSYAIALTAAVALLLAAILIALCVRRTLGLLPRLTAVADRLAGGDLDAEVPGRALKNEIGALSRALDVFRESAVEKIAMERRAHEGVALRERESQERDATKMEETRQLEDAMDRLADGLHRLSDGDLTVRIDTGFAGQLDRLRLDFNQAAEKLRTTLVRLGGETAGIEASSIEMRSATDDLSKRTEQQAASLEQTSASLEEITSTVRSSSAKADEAAEIAGKARVSTERSSAVVSRAIYAMSRIQDASSEISTILNVIDEIAFQTNLLALNAGVEAARAGEAGKGFAVVAQEVRELAQRSASAAKDIKALIRKSGEAVENGVSLVSETGAALGDISSQVALINEHISAMAIATREQSSALSEINGAISCMDQFTQKNAAMVEETNAVTHRLAESAENLSALIAQFRMSDAPAQALSVKLGRSAPVTIARPASPQSRPVASPARRLIGGLNQAFASAAPAPSTASDQWEKF
ncbi:chemotaxis protein [Xaviernesmea oryzae]|uniref:Chemotaxis protein n=1 Tax=Xaviernesmea oryzae TaxID=464029 RepID=A0A1Q9AYB9_9HYPH|nr:methyl-accepting chemotaxis protein [Xaviernesmea oryzae]OLP60410.1 chemotaxis protein [Xaviernesmea oryzae]SEK19648.1 methyl-accepting chemotaxis protein [Xaviernesmea oryzae]